MLRAVSFLSLALLFALPARAADLPYLYERLKNPAYTTAFTELFRRGGDIDPWLRQYLRGGNGVDMPGRAVADGRYELYAICEPHNCAGNFLYILFVPGGEKAWALLTREGANYRYFGAPGPQQTALLTAAAARQ